MHMTRPKYSVVLPTLNGEETLSLTMPAMLRSIDRDDVEWVVSDNHSDDNTYELIASLGDPRVRLVQPPKRLPIGQHLEFAYLQARGEWQGHMGDDDYLFPSRFTVLDQSIEATNAMMTRGLFVRYHWPDYPNCDLANRMDACKYTNNLRVVKGSELAALSLNERTIFGSGAWCVHRSIIDQIRARCGFFSSPQHVEFFAMRAAMTMSPTVAVISLPIYVIGRHEKSSASQGLRPKSETNRSGWDWSFEDPKPWKYNPFQYKGYSPISLDSALMTKNLFPDYLGDVEINWLYWIKCIYGDIKMMIEHEQLPPEAINLFSRGMKKMSFRTRLRWHLSQHPLREMIVMKLLSIIRKPAKPDESGKSVFNNVTEEPVRHFGWSMPLYGETVGVHSIVDVPQWVESTFSWYFPSRE